MQKKLTYVGTKPTETAYFERTGIIWTPGMTAVVLDEFTANEMLDFPDRWQESSEVRLAAISEAVGYRLGSYARAGDTNSQTFSRALAEIPNNSVLIVPNGNYVFDAEVPVVNKIGITIKFVRGSVSGTSNRIRSYFNLSGCLGVDFEGIEFDQMMPSTAVYSPGDYGNLYNTPIYCTNSHYIGVTGCVFTNLYTSAIYFFQSTNLTVDRCRFLSTVQTQTQWLQHIHIQTCGGKNSISRCSFENAAVTSPAAVPAGVYASGISGQLHVVGNSFNYCGRDNTGSHRVGVIDIYGDAENVFVRDNVAKNCMAQFMRLSSTRHGRVTGNKIEINANAEFDYSILTVQGSVSFGGQKGVEDIHVADNEFYDPANRAAYAVGVLSYDWGYPAKDIHVLRNRFDGCRKSVYVGGPFDNVKIEGGSVRNAAGMIQVAHTPGITSTYGTESDGVFDGLVIRGNKHLDPGGTSNAVVINLQKEPAFTGVIGKFDIEDNDFRALVTNGAQAISIYGGASVRQGIFNVRRNITKNYTYDVYARECAEVVVESNRSLSVVTAFYLDNASNGNVIRKMNKLSADALYGDSVLVAGTVTVSTAEVRSGDKIMLTRQAASGTLGHLSVGAITAGASFVINSSSGTDASAIRWEIVH